MTNNSVIIIDNFIFYDQCKVEPFKYAFYASVVNVLLGIISLLGVELLYYFTSQLQLKASSIKLQ